jgi:hypothetical protein
MAYRQYTKCVKLKDFHPSPFTLATINTVAAAVVSGIAILAAGASFGLGASIGIALFLSAAVFALSYVKWWLHGRLICLGGVQCAIGMVVSVEPPRTTQTGWSRFDTDYSFDLLLAPSPPGVNQTDAQAEPIQGWLVAETAALKSAGLPLQGQHSLPCDKTCPSTMNGGMSDCASQQTEALHCEIEGPGMHILYQALKAAVALLTAGEVLSWFCEVPYIGYFLCLIAVILAMAGVGVMGVGLVNGLNSGALPSDVNPALGDSLHTNDCSGTGADLLVVTGEWVYDSLHNGLNEIHPVHSLQKISNDGWSGMWPFDVNLARAAWCGAVTAAHAQGTKDNQQKPENKWKIHPNVDGCNPGGSHFGLEP